MVLDDETRERYAAAAVTLAIAFGTSRCWVAMTLAEARADSPLQPWLVEVQEAMQCHEGEEAETCRAGWPRLEPWQDDDG